ncbi:MAG: ABC transporter permease, partial [Chloroflexota bacterium]
NIQQFMIPAVILGAGLSASLVRMLRSSMLEVLREDYIRTARAKGLDTMSVVRRHMLKNAMIPVVTLFGIQAGTIVGGAVIIENIFNLPGMGRLVIDAISRRDYPLVQGVVMAFGTFILMVNLVTDLVYVWLDPRISYR